MNTQPYVIAILAFAMVNGIFSTVFVPNITGAMILMAPGLLLASPQILIFLVYLIGATLTIMIGGVPAALYERATGAGASTPASMWIWLAGTAIVSLPALSTFLRFGF